MFQHPLAREVAVVVAVKTMVVLAAGLLLFGPRQRPGIDPNVVADRVLAPADATTPRRPAP
jgi:hypothetical protein